MTTGFGSTATSPGIRGPVIRVGGITRLRWQDCNHRQYVHEHLNALKPAIVLGAIDHWPAREKWTPQFFHDCYGTLAVSIDGTTWKLGPLIERILASTPEDPAPYLHNQPLAKWPRELTADISPMPDCTRPNYLESPLFPARTAPTYLEFYLGGAGAKFPTLHYDALHTHAFLMQLHGIKEYLVFAPQQESFLYPRSGIETNRSRIPDIENVDFSAFPLYALAHGMRFQLHPGETLFVPAGWWHTARILTTSITVSINGANAGNWRDFRCDYCAGLVRRSRLKGALVSAYLTLLGGLLSICEA